MVCQQLGYIDWIHVTIYNSTMDPMGSTVLYISKLFQSSVEAAGLPTAFVVAISGKHSKHSHIAMDNPKYRI